MSKIKGFWFSIDKREDINMYEVECATAEGRCSTVFNNIEECKDYVKYHRNNYEWSIDLLNYKIKTVEHEYNNYGWSRE